MVLTLLRSATGEGNDCSDTLTPIADTSGPRPSPTECVALRASVGCTRRPEPSALRGPLSPMPPRLKRTRRGWEEVPPERCSGCGERLLPGEVTVGIVHCTCELRMHRAHNHTVCGATTLTPPAGERCRAVSLDGR